jgi:hypothetical protein
MNVCHITFLTRAAYHFFPNPYKLATLAKLFLTWSSLVFEDMIVAQLVNKKPVLHWSLQLITAFTWEFQFDPTLSQFKPLHAHHISFILN